MLRTDVTTMEMPQLRYTIMHKVEDKWVDTGMRFKFWRDATINFVRLQNSGEYAVWDSVEVKWCKVD